MRVRFYQQFYTWAENQVQILEDMIKIVENEFINLPTSQQSDNSISDNNGKASKWKRTLDQVQTEQTFQDLKMSLVSWKGLLYENMTADNPLPVLPDALVQLELWLHRFQIEFLTMIGEKIPRQMENEIPTNTQYLLNTVNARANYARAPNRSTTLNSYTTLKQPNDTADGVDDEDEYDEKDSLGFISYRPIPPNAQKLKQQQQQQQQQQQPSIVADSPGFMGLADLKPSLKEFLMYLNQKHQFSLVEIEKAVKKTREDYKHHVTNLTMLQQYKSEHYSTLTTSAHKIIQNHNPNKPVSIDPSMTPQQVHNLVYSIGGLSASSQLIRQQHELISDIRQHELGAKKLLSLFNYLKPKLDREKSMVQSLNRIIEVLNTQKTTSAEKWIYYIRSESALSDIWQQTRNTYHVQYLQFRADTRHIVEQIIEEAKTEIIRHVIVSINNLQELYISHSSKLQNERQKHQSELDRTRSLIDYNHQCITGKLENVSSEVGSIMRSTTDSIKSKDQLHDLSFSNAMLELLVMFVQALERVIQVIMSCPSLVSYLQVLDKTCLEHNKMGSAPRPKMIRHPISMIGLSNSQNPNNANNNNHSIHNITSEQEFSANGALGPYFYIQLLEWPSVTEQSMLMSNSDFQRDRAQYLITKGMVYEQEDEATQQEKLKLVKMIQKNYTTKRV